MKNFALMFLAALAAVAVALVAYDKLNARSQERYVNAAYLAQGLAAASQLRLATNMYFQETGKLPCENADIDAGPTQLLGDPVLQGLGLTGCGEITATYAEGSGVAGGKVVLRARQVSEPMGAALGWDCETGDYPGIETYIPQCHYDQALASSPGANEVPAASVIEAPAAPAAVQATPSDCRDGAALYRSVFTDAVKQQTPQRQFVALGPEDQDVLFYTEVVGAAGRRVDHRWLHNNTEIKRVSFYVEADRWRAYSNPPLPSLTPGLLQVEVIAGSCLLGQQSVQIAAETQFDPATRTGWMRPQQALETTLARQAEQPVDPDKRPRRIDSRDDSGDTWLTAAIRRKDGREVLRLLNTHDMNQIPNAHQLSRAEYEKYWHRANPLLLDRDGISPINLAQSTAQSELVEALIASAISPRAANKRRRSNRGPDVGMWGDSLIHTVGIGAGADTRFGDGDTGLIRAVRLGNERAVLTLLQLGREGGASQPQKTAAQLYAYDAGGRQPLDIARDEGHYAIGRFLEIAMQQHSPRWALNRATFASRMRADEPADCRKTAFSDESELHFFAELADMRGKIVRHEWRFNGDTVYTASFDIQSDRWNTQSRRLFSPADVGSWELHVVEGNDNLLGIRRLRYQELTRHIDQNRKSYIGTRGCADLGSSAMYPLVDAHAPISKLQYLLDKGLTLDSKTSRLKDLFYKAITGGNITLTRWFIDRGIDIDATVKNATMPLGIAAKEGDVPMVLFLMAKGADVNQPRYRDKLTALQLATVELNVGVAKVLLEHGADPNIPDQSGATALHRATGRCSAELSALLLEHGGDPLAVTKRGDVPTAYAAKCFENQWEASTPGLAPLLSGDVPTAGL